MPDNIFYLLPYIYFCVVSLISICVTLYDKWASKNRTDRRIREPTLFLWSAAGGSFAMFLTMQAVRHKTKHLSFMIGIPAIMVAHIALLFAIGYVF